MCISNEDEFTPSYVFVKPNKALNFSGEGAERVTPVASLQSLLGQQNLEKYVLHSFQKGAIAVSKCEPNERFSIHLTETSVTVVIGALDNLPYLRRKYQAHDLATDSEMVASLFAIKRFSFLPSLRGKFTFLHYCDEEGQAFAATDVRGTYSFQQGQESTGGLLITNLQLNDDCKLTNVPPASFIFGKYRERDIHKYANTENELSASRQFASSAAERALTGLIKKSVMRKCVSTGNLVALASLGVAEQSGMRRGKSFGNLASLASLADMDQDEAVPSKIATASGNTEGEHSFLSSIQKPQVDSYKPPCMRRENSSGSLCSMTSVDEESPPPSRMRRGSSATNLAMMNTVQKAPTDSPAPGSQLFASSPGARGLKSAMKKSSSLGNLAAMDKCSRNSLSKKGVADSAVSWRSKPADGIPV
ncbi:hypothetical protein CYMTET_38026 [Cymbomonas tetramitiformis]|uniref:Uncharacterized protein n=1 Tax=Cymbomonas tetramitiformis TaxID=36881 RepID=A0AAE0F5V5_9CHLO|nr:hypothetical protein CYMTET_38028 [Cymbomonas tetramitiformis]KAK3252691.1 hypothetical protein CYMTET_38026 [Cymbomonas tetramitiformis]|eukprot:gene10339-12226_t